jgi:hypothetical protein
VWTGQHTGSSLPGGNLVVTATREAALITAKAASITSITTETSVAEAASVAPEASTGTKTIVGLIVAAVTPFDRVRVRRLEPLKKVRHILLGLEENLHEIFGNVFVAVIVEGCGLTLIADSSCTANAMNILGDAIKLSRRQVVVDDVLDIRDIEASSGHAGSNKNWAASGAEGTP